MSCWKRPSGIPRPPWSGRRSCTRPRWRPSTLGRAGRPSRLRGVAAATTKGGAAVGALGAAANLGKSPAGRARPSSPRLPPRPCPRRRQPRRRGRRPNRRRWPRRRRRGRRAGRSRRIPARNLADAPLRVVPSSSSPSATGCAELTTWKVCRTRRRKRNRPMKKKTLKWRILKRRRKWQQRCRLDLGLPRLGRTAQSVMSRGATSSSSRDAKDCAVLTTRNPSRMTRRQGSGRSKNGENRSKLLPQLPPLPKRLSKNVSSPRKRRRLMSKWRLLKPLWRHRRW